MRQLFYTAILTALVGLPAMAFGESLDDLRYTEDGTIRAKLPDVPDQHINPWPESQEDAYWKRATPLIKKNEGKTRTDTTGEHEKWSIPQNILAWLAGTPDMMDKLAVGDQQGGKDHSHTGGFDFYWSFNLKGQARKYFYFKDTFPEGWRKKYIAGAKAWSSGDVKPNMELVLALRSPDEDVRKMAHKMLMEMRGKLSKELAEKATNKEAKQAILEYLESDMAGVDFGQDVEKWDAWYKFFSDRGWKVFEEVERLINIRPHPKYGVGKGPVGAAWDPAVRGFWADARNTDNLRGMREVAAYLFAEETGNEDIRKLYKEKIRRTAYGFMGMGMGEWDSTSYHGHSFAAYLNLYDFAKDEQVVGYAKAILDYLVACGAVKYFHGAWGGPVKRDYGTTGPWDTASETFFPYFGAAPTSKAKSDLEHAFVFTSAYRPPMAIVKMAQKDVEEPFELLNTHPTYENWLPGKGERPAFHETMFYGTTFQMGTLVQGSDGYDTAGAKLAVKDADGVGKLFLLGSAKGKIRRNNAVSTVRGDIFGQYENLVLMLNGSKNTADFFVMAPKSGERESVGDGVIVTLNKTWVAVLPVNASKVQTGKVKPKKAGHLVDLTAKGKGSGPAGLAVIVGDADLYGSYGKFKSAIAAAKITTDDGKVTLSVGDKSVAVAPAGRKIWRNGDEWDWRNFKAVYSPTDGGKAPISLGWKEYKLHVEWDGYTFTGHLTEDGKYISEHTGPGME